MCDIGTAFSVVSGVVGFIGDQRKAKAERDRATFNAKIADNNRIITERAAEDAILRGEADAAKQGEKTRQFKARQKTAAAGQGLPVKDILALQLDAGSAGREEGAIIRRNAEREALGFRTQGMNFAASAELALIKGEQATRAAGFNAFGTLLTIGSDVNTAFNKRPKSPSTVSAGPQGPEGF